MLSISDSDSCEVPPAPAGVSLSKQGMVPSDVVVTATCTEDMKVLLGKLP